MSGNRSENVWLIVLARYGAAQTTFWVVVDRVPGLKDWLLSHFNAPAATQP